MLSHGYLPDTVRLMSGVICKRKLIVVRIWEGEARDSLGYVDIILLCVEGGLN